ncbi:MAG: glycosyltransferase family 39 protein, partial [Planctomycetaceae bacterium]|nr:glycosyltransferase family 39 protein [Planctomycetaceae bacterium]
MLDKRYLTILLFLCVLVLLIIVPLPYNFSYVYNEDGRIASGLIHLEIGDYSTFHVNPPLVDMLGSFPAFCAQTYCPTFADLGFSHLGRMEGKAGTIWVNKNVDHFYWAVLGRYCVMIIFVLGGMIICYVWTKKVLGIYVAITVSLIWMFSPYILGNGCLICPDVPSATTGVVALYFFHCWLKHSEILESLIAGIVLGLAELTKFTLLIFYPLFVVIWLVYRLSEIKTLTKKDWYQQFKQ